MRGKKIIVVVTCLILLVFVLSGMFRSEPSISMGVLHYVDKSDNWFPAAMVGITNNGSVMVRYDQLALDEPNLLRTESQTGWASEPFIHFGVTVAPELLGTGSNVSYLVPLPQGTLRWQLGYTIRSASALDRVGSKLTGDFGDRIHSLCRRLLSTNEGPPKAVWSKVFEVPKGTNSPATSRQ